VDVSSFARVCRRDAESVLSRVDCSFLLTSDVNRCVASIEFASGTAAFSLASTIGLRALGHL
jgi:hypothetical protein